MHEIERLKKQVETVTETAIGVLTGRCEHPTRHNASQLSFTDFLARGGGDCPICLNYRIDDLHKALQRIYELPPHTDLAEVDDIIREVYPDVTP